MPLPLVPVMLTLSKVSPITLASGAATTLKTYSFFNDKKTIQDCYKAIEENYTKVSANYKEIYNEFQKQFEEFANLRSDVIKIYLKKYEIFAEQLITDGSANLQIKTAKEQYEALESNLDILSEQIYKILNNKFATTKKDQKSYSLIDVFFKTSSSALSQTTESNEIRQTISKASINILANKMSSDLTPNTSDTGGLDLSNTVGTLDSNKIKELEQLDLTTTVAAATITETINCATILCAGANQIIKEDKKKAQEYYEDMCELCIIIDNEASLWQQMSEKTKERTSELHSLTEELQKWLYAIEKLYSVIKQGENNASCWIELKTHIDHILMLIYTPLLENESPLTQKILNSRKHLEEYQIKLQEKWMSKENTTLLESPNQESKISEEKK